MGPRSVGFSSSNKDLAPLGLRFLESFEHILDRPGINQRSHQSLLIEGIADGNLSVGFDQAAGQLFADVLVHDDATGARAAAGAFAQLAGCPSEVTEALGRERIDRICAGECYHPSDERRHITRIEVVRIGRQMKESEAVDELIEDPWLTIPCPADAEVCEVDFEDPWYSAAGREVLYYVRAIQEPTPAVNAGLLRCDGDECDPCYGDYRVPLDEDCLSMNQERAWSSPIYLTAPAPACEPVAASGRRSQRRRAHALCVAAS